ncbi:MAG: hypothetical protein ACI9W2_005311, partial [Gammaproteobacteria bacterium]
ELAARAGGPLVDNLALPIGERRGKALPCDAT